MSRQQRSDASHQELATALSRLSRLVADEGTARRFAAAPLQTLGSLSGLTDSAKTRLRELGSGLLREVVKHLRFTDVSARAPGSVQRDPAPQWQQADGLAIAADLTKGDTVDQVWYCGCISDALPMPGTSVEFLVASETGGLWTIDTSGTAQPVGESVLNPPNLRHLATGPLGPAHVFAGGFYNDFQYGSLFESDPADSQLASWRQIMDRSSGVGPIQGLVATPYTVSGLQWTRVVVATPTGVYWTVVTPLAVDAPVTWELAASPAGSTDFRGAVATSKGIVTTCRDGYIYLGTWTGPGASLVLQRVPDGYSETLQVVAPFELGCLANSSANPDIVYAMLSNAQVSKVYDHPTGNSYCGQVGAILRSADGGATWNPVLANWLNPTNDTTTPSLIGLQWGMAGCGLAETGQSPNNYRLSGSLAVSASGEWVVLATEAGPFLSRDSGANWTQIMGIGPGLAEAGVDFRTVRFLEGGIFPQILACGDRGIARADLLPLDQPWALGMGTWDWSLSRTVLTMQFEYHIAHNLATVGQATIYGDSRVACLPAFTGGIGASSSGLVSGGVMDNGVIVTNASAPTFWRRVAFGDGCFGSFVNAPQEILLFSVDGSGASSIHEEMFCSAVATSDWGAKADSGEYVLPTIWFEDDVLLNKRLYSAIFEPMSVPNTSWFAGFPMVGAAVGNVGLVNNQGEEFDAIGYEDLVYAILQDDGKRVSLFRIGRTNAVNTSHTAVLATGNTVLVGSNDGHIWSFDLSGTLPKEDAPAVAEIIPDQFYDPTRDPPHNERDLDTFAVVRIVQAADPAGTLYAGLSSYGESEVFTSFPPGATAAPLFVVLRRNQLAPDIFLWTIVDLSPMSGASAQRGHLVGMCAGGAGEIYLATDCNDPTWQSPLSSVVRVDASGASDASRGLPAGVRCADIHYNPSDGTVYLATIGRSLWRLNS